MEIGKSAALCNTIRMTYGGAVWADVGIGPYGVGWNTWGIATSAPPPCNEVDFLLLWKKCEKYSQFRKKMIDLVDFFGYNTAE